MLKPKSLEEVAELVQKPERTVYIFMTEWCSDCHFIKPSLSEIESTFPDWTFVELDRDNFLPLAEKWGIFGIPSLVVLENGQEVGRLVNKLRKSKEEIIDFLKGI